MLISIIIPSRDEKRKENLNQLLDDISKQKLGFPIEVLPICQVSPSGKARNIGVEKSKGDILVFIDDDIHLADEQVISNLVKPLLENASIAVTFSSLLIPIDSSKFQRRYARDIPRCEIPVVDKLTPAGAMSTHCCAMRKDLFMKIGKFNEQLKRGEDPEFSYRLKAKGLNIALVPRAISYHPVPKNIKEVIKLHFRNGRASAFADRYYPQLNIDVNPQGIIYPAKIQSKLYRLKRFVIVLAKAILGFKFLLIISKLSYILGYFRCRLVK
jgi:GT2 family glycosyltransferase